MAEVNRRWIYPTVTASENKGIERIALSGEGLAHEVVGIDGSRKFGCRPCSGFRLAHELEIYTNFSLAANRPFSSVAPPTQAKTSTVTDCYPVHIQMREGEFAHGFVYRVRSIFGGDCAIYLDVYTTAQARPADNSGTATSGWHTYLISEHSQSHVDANANMDVISMGRYVFVLVKGRPTRVFYFEYNGFNFDYKVVDGGPGAASVYEGTTGVGQWSSTPDPLRFEVVSGGGGHTFEAGDYSFAFYLHNSLTGRRTPLSEIHEKSVASANDYMARVEVDTTKYDQIYLFRSVRLQSVGGVYAGCILHLDGIYDFADFVPQDDNASPYDTGVYEVYEFPYELDDIALAMQSIYLDRVAYDKEMPYAGTGVAFEGSLIVSDPQSSREVFEGGVDTPPTGPGLAAAVSLADRIRNTGEIRWSSLTERSPELFPIANKYNTDVYQNRVFRLVRTGDFAIGFSRDRVYHIRRNGIYLRIDDLHAGYGLTGYHAACSVGPLVYFVTNKGLKAVANNGQLDDVMALDNLLLEDWYDDLEDLRLSADPYAGCLFVYNPNKEQSVCLWFGTGRVSEIHDADFTDVKQGIWAKSWTKGSYSVTSASTMVERSFWTQNAPTITSTQIPDGWKPRVYVLDFDRQKTSNGGNLLTNGDSVVRTLDFDGDAFFTVHSVSTAIGVTTAVLKQGAFGALNLSSGSDGFDLVGAYAYIVGSTDPSKIGLKRQIYLVNPGAVSADGTYGGGGNVDIHFNRWDALASGDIIALSPVFFRYVGGALPMVRTEDNQVVSTMDLFQNKQASSVGCHFADVSGGTEGYRFFKGLVYNTESDSPAVSAFPVDFAGTILGDSITVGESENYAAFTAAGLTTTGRHGIQDSALNPGIEIFCPDVDYKLMAVICRGRTTNTDSNERTSP